MSLDSGWASNLAVCYPPGIVIRSHHNVAFHKHHEATPWLRPQLRRSAWERGRITTPFTR